jgi:hypothetical protein
MYCYGTIERCDLEYGYGTLSKRTDNYAWAPNENYRTLSRRASAIGPARLSDEKIFFGIVDNRACISYNDGSGIGRYGDSTMETMINDITKWVFSDLNNLAYIIGAIVVLGAINGIRCSLAHCGRSRHIGRRVL